MFDSKKSKIAYCQTLHLTPAQPRTENERGIMKLETIPLEVDDSHSQALMKINSNQLDLGMDIENKD